MKMTTNLKMLCASLLIVFFTATSVSPIMARGDLTPVTFVFAADVVASGAINATGTYDMPVTGAGNYMAIHCIGICTFPDGTLNIRLDCEFGSVHGQWRIVSGTGAYAGINGNGSLIMTDTAEILTGNIFHLN
jgi:hypothetical protein